MSWGAKLCLNSAEDKEKFKQAINRNTTIGSFVDSGDHLRGVISPMCDYDTQSVINVIGQGLLNLDLNVKSHVSERVEYYKDEWK